MDSITVYDTNDQHLLEQKYFHASNLLLQMVNLTTCVSLTFTSVFVCIRNLIRIQYCILSVYTLLKKYRYMYVDTYISSTAQLNLNFLHMYVYVCMYVQYVRIYVYMYIRTYVCTYTHTYVHTIYT